MFFLNISLAYIAALCFLSLSGYSLAFEITNDDMHAYRVNKKLNGRLKYTGYFIAPTRKLQSQSLNVISKAVQKEYMAYIVSVII